MRKINYYFAQFIILILPSAAIMFENYRQVLGAPAPSISNDSNLAQTSQIQPTFHTNQNEKDTNYNQSYIGIGANFGINGNATGITDTNFAILGKTAFTENFANKIHYHLLLAVYLYVIFQINGATIK